MASKLNPQAVDKMLKSMVLPSIMLCGDSNFEKWVISQINNFNVVNCGRNGNTVVSYFPPLKKVKWRRVPSVIAVMFGTNDCRSGTETLATYKSVYTPMLTLLKSKAPTVVVGILPHEAAYNPALPVSDFNYDSTLFNQAAKEMANGLRLPFIDWAGKFPASGYTEDGIHMNATGKEIMRATFVLEIPWP